MASSTTAPQERDVMWKVTLRLIPFLFLLYVVNILDRVNVGFAALQMQDSLEMSEQVFAFGASVFFIGYFFFEVPSNLIMRRTGARMWMARIMITWGLISAAMMFVRGTWSFYCLRFLLGLAEAGFFPGMILYLSYWFPARARSRAVSRFMVASPVAGVLGYPISGAILKYMDQVGGLAAWQWLFLLEGLPSVLLGVAAWLYLTDRPEQAHWLEPEEREWLAQRMSREEKHREERHGFTIFQSMASRPIWLLSALYFTVAMGSNTFGVFLPKIIEAQLKRAESQSEPDKSQIARHEASETDESQSEPGKTKVAINPLRVGMLAAIPSLMGMIAMVLVGIHSDRTGERRWHVAGSAFVAATGWGLSWYCQSGSSEWQLVLAMSLAQIGMMSMLGPFWTLPTSFLHGAAAAAGIAFINSLGNLGGFVGQNAMGYSKEVTGNYGLGSMALGGVLLIGGFLALLARHDATVETMAVEVSP